MTTIFELTNNALAAITPSVSYAMDDLIGELPETYIVYSLISGVGEIHADNLETARTYRVQVSIMSRSGLASLPDVDTPMLAAGFTKGPERPIPKDSTTSHYGLAKDYFYLM